MDGNIPGLSPSTRAAVGWLFEHGYAKKSAGYFEAA